MEEHQSAAHATPEAEQMPPPPPEQKQPQVVLAVAVAPAAAENGEGPAEGGHGSPAAKMETALLGGPRRTGLHLFVMNLRSVFKLDELGAEVLGIAVPASLALTADPLASLIDTAFIGRLGSVEIAAVGVAIAVFNQVMKVCIYPLVSVTTSFVAEEDAILSTGGAKVVDVDGDVEQEDPDQHAAVAATDPEKQQSAEEATKNNGDSNAEPGDASPAELAGAEGCAPAVAGRRKSGKNRRFVSSVTSALIVGAFLGLFQTVLLVAAGKPLLRLMGVKSVSHSAHCCPQQWRRRLQICRCNEQCLYMSPGQFSGFVDDDPRPALPDAARAWCPGRAPLSRHARRLPRLQGHQDAFIRHR